MVNNIKTTEWQSEKFFHFKLCCLSEGCVYLFDENQWSTAQYLVSFVVSSKE